MGSRKAERTPDTFNSHIDPSYEQVAPTEEDYKNYDNIAYGIYQDDETDDDETPPPGWGDVE